MLTAFSAANFIPFEQSSFGERILADDKVRMTF
jgi:hypothetical protein